METQLETKLKILQFVIDNRNVFTDDLFADAERIYQWDINLNSPTQKDKLKSILDEVATNLKPKPTDQRKAIGLAIEETKMDIPNSSIESSFAYVSDLNSDLNDLEKELNELESNN